MLGRKILGVGLLTGGLLINCGTFVYAAKTEGMDHYRHTYLPIGSVIVLEENKEPLMITGYNSEANKKGYIYDYIGCSYPSGVVLSEVPYYFDQKDIKRVNHIGFVDDKADEFLYYLDNNMENIKDGKVDLLDNSQETESEVVIEERASTIIPTINIFGVDIEIPSTLSEWLDAGWILEKADSVKIVPANSESSITLKRGKNQIILYVCNSSENDKNIKDTTVYKIDASTNKESLPLTILNNIKVGMPVETLDAFLMETSFDSVKDYMGTYCIYLDKDHDKILMLFTDGVVKGVTYSDYTLLNK